MQEPLTKPGHSCQLLQGSVEFFPALIEAMQAAQQEICLETYLFDTARQGQSVAQALAAAAQRGVQVRVILDGVGSRAMSPEWLARWTQAGVQWCIFEPLGTGGIWNPSRWRRLHRKLCVVDSQVAFCGGINMLDDYHDPHASTTLAQPRLDFAVRLTGHWVAGVHATMTQLWGRLEFARKLRSNRLGAAMQASLDLDLWPLPDKRGAIRLVLRDNWRHRNSIMRTYLKAIGQARQDILIANAFFMPGRKLRRALRQAAARGVRVRLILPGQFEYEVPYRASRMVYRQLLAAGIEIHEYHASYLHAKVAVIDGHWSTVGSSNLDPLSLLLAREANLVIQDPGFATDLQRRLERALTDGAHPVRPDLERLSWWERVKDGLAYGLLRTLVFLNARDY